jgi:hypothetical protein
LSDVLPPPCSECADNDGAWKRAANGGLQRCGCARGTLLAEADEVSKAARVGKAQKAADKAAKKRPAWAGWKKAAPVRHTLFDGKEAGASGGENDG